MAGYNVKIAPKGAYGTKPDPNKWAGGIYINDKYNAFPELPREAGQSRKSVLQGKGGSVHLLPDSSSLTLPRGGIHIPELDEFGNLLTSNFPSYGTMAHAARGSALIGGKTSKLDIPDDVQKSLLQLPVAGKKIGSTRMPAMVAMKTNSKIADSLGFPTDHVYTGRLNVSPDVNTAIMQSVATRQNPKTGRVSIEEPSIWYAMQNAGLRPEDFKIKGRSLGRLRNNRDVSIPEEINVGFKRRFSHMADFSKTCS